MLVKILGEGQGFGEMGILTNSRRSATILALENTDLFVL